MEEQKPNGLFEKEIKKEIDDSSQEIKEEPLDEEYLKQNHSKFGEVVEPCQQSEPSFSNMSNDEISNSSSQIFKQQPVWSEPSSVVAMEDAKIESIDEFKDDLDSEMHLKPAIIEKQNRKGRNRCCSACFQIKNRKFMKEVRSVHDKLIIIIKLVIRDEFTFAEARSFMYQKKRVPICYSHFPEALNEICRALCIQNLEELRSCPPPLMQYFMFTVNAILPELSISEFCDILNKFNTRNHYSFRKGIPSKIERVNEPSTQFMPHQDLYLNNTQPVQIISNGESSSSTSQSFVENSKQEQKLIQLYSGPIHGLEVDNVKLEPIEDIDDDEDASKICHDNTMYTGSKQRNRYCAVCSQLKNDKLLKYARLAEDKLMIMIKLVLCGEYTIEKAQSFMSKTKRVLICYAHFPEALNEICSALHIQKLEEVYSCSSELMQNLMVTVNALSPQLSTSNFRNIWNNFVIRNQHIFRLPHLERKPGEQELQNIILNESENRGWTGNMRSRHLNYTCRVCAQLKPCKELRTIQSEENKLMIMIGCFLRGDYTLEPAQLFMSQTNRCFVCQIHFSQSIDEIYKALNIKHYEKIALCSAEKMKNLMIIVNDFIPELKAWEFCNKFEALVKNQRKLAGME